MSQPLRVLIVEDSLDDTELLLLELKSGGYDPIDYLRVETAAAMQVAFDDPKGWDVVIADHEMPQFSAIAALSLLRERGFDIPFMIVSGSIREDLAVAAMKAGAQDYLYKGNLARLIPALDRELREAQLRREHRQTQARIKYRALFDELTGLPNRNLFLQRLRQRLERVSTSPLFSVLFLNLNRFQMVKYSLGHGLSEQLILATAERLKECVLFPNVLARMRGDEFIILLTDIQEPSEALDLAERIQKAFARPFNLDERIVYSPASIGIVLSNTGYQQAEEFLRAADIAKHYAQMKSHGGSVLYDASMQQQVRERLELETDLQEAIKNNQLYLNYQPIVSLETEKITGFEALVRWRHPRRGLISPVEFIPLAEETGLIIPLGQWALQEACYQLRFWQESFGDQNLSMSVNLSGLQLANPDLIRQIDELLASASLSGDCLKLEITESYLMENLIDNAAIANNILEQLKERQIKLCIDDFGTGYSSLSYLHYLPIDILKIDRSFINPTSNTRKNSEIVKSIVNLAQDLGLALVAEGVETAKQLEMLKQLKCDYGQGYFFARPLEVHQVGELINRENFWASPSN